MKRTLVAALIAFALASTAFGQTKGKTPSRSTASVTPGLATASALKKLERDWFDAIARQDTLALGRLMADDYLATNHEGLTSVKADLIEQVKSGALKIEASSADAQKVRVMGTTAIITGQAKVNGQRIPGGDIATRRAARTPPPPSMFCTTTVCPVRSPSLIATQRPIVSAKPPTANPTMKEMRWLG